MRTIDTEEYFGDDVMHTKELSESEEEAGPPREDSEGIEDEKKGEGREREDGEISVARGERPNLQPPVLVVTSIQQPALESREALQFGGHISRRLALLLPRSDIGSRLNQPLDACRIPFDRRPMQGSQPRVIRPSRIGSSAQEQIDRDGVSLIASPVKGGMTFRVGGIDGDGLRGEKHVSEEEGRGGVDGEVEAVEGLGIEQVGIGVVVEQEVDDVKMAIPVDGWEGVSSVPREGGRCEDQAIAARSLRST